MCRLTQTLESHGNIHCDMTAETRIVEPEETANAGERSIKAFPRKRTC